MSSCISVRNLTKRYGRGGVAAAAAVDDVTFEVRQGEVFGFLGPNGAGKSTTIKLLTTLMKPTAGSISVLGIDALAEPLRVRHQIGVVLQQPSYEPTLSVEKALDRYGMMWGVHRDERRKRTESLLDEFDLRDIKNMRNEDLSIGQRRRVQVAREFMHDMKLLFLDEPTVGLDPGARRDLLDYLRDKVDETGLSIFYTTHILTEAEYLCDEIGIMNRGRLVEIDTPDALKSRLGAEKTVKIHLSLQHDCNNRMDIGRLLSGVQGCHVGSGYDHDDGDGGSSGDGSAPGVIHSKGHRKDGTATITIRSSESELVLLQVLRILSDAGIQIDDLSAVPTSLEEIFLDMIDVDRKRKKGNGGDRGDGDSDSDSDSDTRDNAGGGRLTPGSGDTGTHGRGRGEA